MKSFAIAFIAVIFAALVVAAPLETEDELSASINKCLENLNLTDVEELTEQQTFCLNGCLMQTYQLIGADGKLLPNGNENFLKNLPAAEAKEYPELKTELEKLAPELLEAENPCDAGAIASDAVEDLFSTEMSED